MNTELKRRRFRRHLNAVVDMTCFIVALIAILVIVKMTFS